MKPVRTARSNFVWMAPSPEVGDLHGELDRDHYRTTTVWTLSPYERDAIAGGANIALIVIGRHPPVSLHVTHEQGIGEDAPEILERLEAWRASQDEART